MIRCVITGTRRGRPDVERWLERFVRKHGDVLFIVGDAAGVDTQAWNWCKANRSHVRCARVFVKPGIPSPKRYHDRNQRMVTGSTLSEELGGIRCTERICLALPDDEARGTWDCYARAKLAGIESHALPLVDERWNVLKRFPEPEWLPAHVRKLEAERDR